MGVPRPGRLEELLAESYPDPTARRRLLRLMELLSTLPAPPDPWNHFSRYETLQQEFIRTLDDRDADRIEESFLELYAHLHMHEAPYSVCERRAVDASGGYWCHAGGLSPILMAAPWIRPDSVSADLGAGNGLQGLLLQVLSPHRLTVQVEISERMVAIGRALQQWLGIEADRVRWVVGDLLEWDPQEVDFLYLYRPVRPEGPGASFYRRLADRLARSGRQVVVFSIADCLRSFLPASFEVFYSDGHLTCYRGPMTTASPAP
jgi:hypothetical protein